MLPRFSNPTVFWVVDNTGPEKANKLGVGEAEAKGTKVGGIIEEADDANIWKLGWTVKGMVKYAVPDASEDIPTLTYHNSNSLHPFAYLEIGSSKLIN